ncbi:MAG: slipin family protein [Pseudomonadota bacterium]
MALTEKSETMILRDFIYRIAGLERIVLTENQRVITFAKGKITGILKAGAYVIPRKDAKFELHDIVRTPELQSAYEKALLRTAGEMVADHLMPLQSGAQAVTVVFRDDAPMKVLRPDAKVTLWVDAGPFRVEEIDIAEAPVVPAKLAQRLTRAGLDAEIDVFEVPEGYVGLMFVDGALQDSLAAGTHRFWKSGRRITVSLIDLRMRAHEVSGQEILTKDRVSLRVNITAEFRVTDPVKAVTSVADHQEALHRSLQFAFRKTLGAKTLDEILSEKVSVDASAADTVRSEMAKIGIEVSEISLKDVILPGEMREILNQVVAAQKEAEANVIRRREETNATRSLLNTAKVMAENPVMLRLKELEALEIVASKVDQLTVHNGTTGLMTEIVKLAD